jgi:hypothetical protein
MSKLVNLVSEVSDISTKMHNAVVELLKENGGIIRTDNNERMLCGKQFCSTVYAITQKDDDEPLSEKRVLAVALIGEEQVAVLTESCKGETIKGLTDQELLNLDRWEWVNGGFVHKTATLESICECIEEYLQ